MYNRRPSVEPIAGDVNRGCATANLASPFEYSNGEIGGRDSGLVLEEEGERGASDPAAYDANGGGE